MQPLDTGIAPNARRLLWAGFMAILAAGIGFGIRGGILDNWGREYGFTAGQLGAIGGAGFTGFCFGIIIGGVIADKIGYGKLVIAAFAFHVLSAFITFFPSEGMAQSTVYGYLYWGTFTFAVANGVLEAVSNPLVATLFPKNRTHYLNILHASWPAGLVIGGAMGWILDDQMEVSWKLQLALFLIPTAIYGWMFFGQKMPKSEASAQGLSIGDMFKDVGMLGGLVICFLLSLFFKNALGLSGPVAYGIGVALLVVIAFITKFSVGAVLLFVLFVAHALIGAVELGTDGWIQNITGNILSSGEGKILFVFTSMLMFALRFCAHWIEKNLKLTPVGILLVCSIFAWVGLLMVSRIETFLGAMAALSIYAIGKTFFWPTMLAVASDRFPRTGAVAISIMGGIGMMSAGLIGSQGLGYAKDRFAGEALQSLDQQVYEEYRAENPSQFLFFAPSYGLDGLKFGEVTSSVQAARRDTPDEPEAALEKLPREQRLVYEASIMGDRKTLVADSFIPAIMALIYLGIMLYFKSIGGYRTVHLAGSEPQPDAPVR